MLHKSDVWRDKDLKEFNICVRCSYDSSKYTLRRLTRIFGQFIYVESIDSDDKELKRFKPEFETPHLLTNLSNTAPAITDHNPHEFAVPIGPITAGVFLKILSK